MILMTIGTLATIVAVVCFGTEGILETHKLGKTRKKNKEIAEEAKPSVPEEVQEEPEVVSGEVEDNK